jgi:hypothetical protein
MHASESVCKYGEVSRHISMKISRSVFDCKFRQTLNLAQISCKVATCAVVVWINGVRLVHVMRVCVVVLKMEEDTRGSSEGDGNHVTFLVLRGQSIRT